MIDVVIIKTNNKKCLLDYPSLRELIINLKVGRMDKIGGNVKI